MFSRGKTGGKSEETSLKNKSERISVLRTQHKQLEEKLEVAQNQLEGNERVNFIKQQKLRIKDEIAKLERELANG